MLAKGFWKGISNLGKGANFVYLELSRYSNWLAKSYHFVEVSDNLRVQI